MELERQDRVSHHCNSDYRDGTYFAIDLQMSLTGKWLRRTSRCALKSLVNHSSRPPKNDNPNALSALAPRYRSPQTTFSSSKHVHQCDLRCNPYLACKDLDSRRRNTRTGEDECLMMDCVCAAYVNRIGSFHTERASFCRTRLSSYILTVCGFLILDGQPYKFVLRPYCT